jgi:hypothetical protein
MALTADEKRQLAHVLNEGKDPKTLAWWKEKQFFVMQEYKVVQLAVDLHDAADRARRVAARYLFNEAEAEADREDGGRDESFPREPLDVNPAQTEAGMKNSDFG